MIYYCLVLMEKPLKTVLENRNLLYLEAEGVLFAWNMHIFWKKNSTVTTTLEKNEFRVVTCSWVLRRI